MKLSEKVIKKASGLQNIDFMNLNPDLAKLISSNIDLIKIKYYRINESTVIPSQLFLSWLRGFKDVYTGRKRYLEVKMEELSSLFMKNLMKNKI